MPDRMLGVRRVVGIRYAKTPGGARFVPSVAAAGDGIPGGRLRDVPLFPQRRGRLTWFMGDAPGRNPHDEQAFTLNVWAPETAEGLPVLVFLHGGAWVSGGGAAEWYDGSALAARGLVVVTVSYRIGALAHLAEPGSIEQDRPRNVVLDDLLLALGWVQEHVAAYGGDPGRVTLAGQSAGSWYAHMLSLMPEAAGLFRRVAHLSLPGREPWSAERQAEISGVAAATLADGSSLADAPLDALLDAGAAGIRPKPAFGTPAEGYLPVRDDRTPTDLFVPASAAARTHVEAAYLRFTTEESGVFLYADESARSADRAQVEAWLAEIPADELPPGDLPTDPYATLVRVNTWRTFARHAVGLSDAYAAAGLPTALRRFVHRSPQPGVGSGHCVDLPFQLGVRSAWHDALMLAGVDDTVFASVSSGLVDDLVGFVSTPDAAGITARHEAGRPAVDLGST